MVKGHQLHKVQLSQTYIIMYREIGGEITHDGDFLVFESNHFRNGFMYKSFGMGAIVSQPVQFGFRLESFPGGGGGQRLNTRNFVGAKQIECLLLIMYA